MRSTAVLMAGFALLLVGVLVLALSGPLLVGVGLVVAGVLVKIGGFLVGGEPSPGGKRVTTASGARSSEGVRSLAGGVVVRARQPARRPLRPAAGAPTVARDPGQKRAS